MKENSIYGQDKWKTFLYSKCEIRHKMVYKRSQLLEVHQLSSGNTILDIGSASYSLLPLFLAAQKKYTIYATDIDEYVFKHIDLIKKIGLGCLIEDQKYRVEKQDATKLSYNSESFDRVTAVSSIEHIPDDGDAKAIKEIARVLKDTGLAVLTVPFNCQYKETFVNENVYERKYQGKPIFYQRHYDKIALEERLIKPSGMKLKKIVYFGEKGFKFESRWNNLHFVIKALFGWMMPLFSRTFISRIDENQLEKAMTACLVLEKQR